jgi:hypothetical protein
MDDLAEALRHAPQGFDIWTHTEVLPKQPPGPPVVTLHWTIGPVRSKTNQPAPGTGTGPFTESEITVQLTADQQVALSIRGEDKYDNPVEITGDTAWTSSDESIIAIQDADIDSCVAVAVGPVGTASVTVTNDVNRDGTGDFMGSLAIDVVAGDIAEVVIVEGTPEDKPTTP